MAKLDVTKLDDATLRANPYLALTASGQIRPGEGEVQPDQTMGQAAEVLGAYAQYKDAKFASEDKTSIIEWQTSFDDLMSKTKLELAEGEPEGADQKLQSTIEGYIEKVSTDESLSAVARKGILQYIQSARQNTESIVSSDVLVRLGSKEKASLINQAQGAMRNTIKEIAAGDPFKGTNAVAKYLADMQTYKANWLASRGTAFGGTEEALLAFNNEINKGMSAVAEALIASDNPAYTSQIDNILGGEYAIDNYAALKRQHDAQTERHKNDHAKAQVDGIYSILNNASGDETQVIQQKKRTPLAQGFQYNHEGNLVKALQ